MSKAKLTKIDKNDLIDVFSDSMGDSEKIFIEFATNKEISDYKELIKEFKLIQNWLYDFIYKMTEPNLQLTALEIESISHDLCKSKINRINLKGIKAVNRWLIWMCWHEGLLKKDS